MAAGVLVGGFCLCCYFHKLHREEYNLKCQHPGIWTMRLDMLGIPIKASVEKNGEGNQHDSTVRFKCSVMCGTASF